MSTTKSRRPAGTRIKRTAAAKSPDEDDLKSRLLRATDEILNEQGVENFSLREAARRSGVSHGAPAFHYGDAAGLLTAYAAEGFDTLAKLMLRYRSDAKPDAKSQLAAAGLAYIDYAIGHRARFQLMFRSDRLRAEEVSLKEAAARAFAQLQAVVAPFIGPGRTKEQERSIKLLMAWSIVHGFATLVLEGHLAHFQGASISAAVRHQMSRKLIERFVEAWNAGPDAG
jgi:AcrR family transcriptional regulator